MDARYTVEGGRRIWSKLGGSKADVAYAVIVGTRIAVYHYYADYYYMRIHTHTTLDLARRMQNVMGGYLMSRESGSTWMINERQGIRDFGALLFEMAQYPPAPKKLQKLARLVYVYGAVPYGKVVPVAKAFLEHYGRSVRLVELADLDV